MEIKKKSFEIQILCSRRKKNQGTIRVMDRIVEHAEVTGLQVGNGGLEILNKPSLFVLGSR